MGGNTPLEHAIRDVLLASYNVGNRSVEVEGLVVEKDRCHGSRNVDRLRVGSRRHLQPADDAARRVLLDWQGVVEREGSGSTLAEERFEFVHRWQVRSDVLGHDGLGRLRPLLRLKGPYVVWGLTGV